MADGSDPQVQTVSADPSETSVGASKRTFSPAFLANMGQWKHKQPDQSGRKKGLAAQIRERTANGDDLIAVLLAAMRGEMSGIRPRDRIEATKTLLERGWGRAIEIKAELDASTALSLGSEQIEALARALTSATTAKPISAPVVSARDTITDGEIVNPRKP